MTTSYGAELSATWVEHLAPRKPDAPTVVSTFAGCGGSSLGYSMAGYRELLAVEWDDHAATCFVRNLPDVPLFHGDIADLRPSRLDLAPGELDVLDGSPPCQGFSVSGNRDVADPRNGLFRQYVRLLEAWRPRMFVMENVPGLTIGEMRPIFADIMRALRAAGPGYRVTARVVDMAWFRVPQHRRRLIFVGVRADLDIEPVHPRPTSRPPTVRDAFADLPKDGLRLTPGDYQSRVLRITRPGQNGAAALGERGYRRSCYSLARLHWNRPSHTILASVSGGGVSPVHPSEDRYVDSREMTRLQSFPDEYDWGDSSYRDIRKRVGNSVPPMFMRAVAATLADTLDRT